MSSASIFRPRARFSPLSAMRRAQKLRIGGEEVRGRQRGGHLAQVELRLVALVGIEIIGALDQIVRPARRQHIGLLDEVEIRIVAPSGIGEALVGGVGRGDGRRLFALEALQCRTPKIDELRGQRRLRLKGPLRIGHVMFGHPADGTHHFADVVGGRGLDLPALPRAQVSGERLAALLDRERDIAGERLHVGERRLGARGWRRIKGANPRGRRRRAVGPAPRPAMSGFRSRFAALPCSPPARAARRSARAGALRTSLAVRRSARRGAGGDFWSCAGVGGSTAFGAVLGALRRRFDHEEPSLEAPCERAQARRPAAAAPRGARRSFRCAASGSDFLSALCSTRTDLGHGQAFPVYLRTRGPVPLLS